MNKTAKFMSDCFNNGISNFGDIIKHAKKRIGEIDEHLKNADSLRIERLSLMKVLSDLGDDNLKRRKNIEVPALDFDDDSEDAINLRKKICEAIDQNGPLTNRELMQKVGSYSEDAKIIHAIKYLGASEIIRRDGTVDNKIIPGLKWDKRDQQTAETS